MNGRILRSCMVLHGDTLSSLAAYIGIATETLCRKLSGKYAQELRLSEARAILERYALSPEAAIAIFFTDDVSEKVNNHTT